MVLTIDYEPKTQTAIAGDMKTGLEKALNAKKIHEKVKA
jgi:hypothetical protein